MVVVKRPALLLLLAVVCAKAAETTDDCHFEPLQKSDLHVVSGEWVLVWSVSDSPVGQALLPRVKSSHVELTVPDNETVTFVERNMYIDTTCGIYHLNMTVSDDADHHALRVESIIFEQNGESGPFNDSATVAFFRSSPDCIQLAYNSTAMGRYLMSYRRDGQHRDVEQVKAVEAEHKKMAECLGFPHDNPYEYDGVSDFCHKKSAPEVAADES